VVDADKALIRVSKTLLDSPELQAIRTLDGDIRHFLYDMCLPFEVGIHLLPLGLVETVDERLQEFKDKRGELVETFLSAYPRLCQEAAGRLRTLYNPADYPPIDVVDDQDLKEQVDKARALLEGVNTDALRNMPLVRASVREGMAEVAAQMDVLAGDRVTQKFRFDIEGGRSHVPCDFTHNLSAGGTIKWPNDGRGGFVFNTAEAGSLGRWKHNVAPSANWRHNLAGSAT
jgi:hypothetical protein